MQQPAPFPQPERTHIVRTTTRRAGSAPTTDFKETAVGEPIEVTAEILALGLKDNETLDRVLRIEIRRDQDVAGSDVTREVLSRVSAILTAEDIDELPKGLIQAYRDYDAPLPAVRYTSEPWLDEIQTTEDCLDRRRA